MNALQGATETVYSRRMARTLIDRMDEVLAARGWSEREWMDRANASHGTVSALRRRLASNPQAKMNAHTLRSLASAAGVSETWLRTGHGTRDLATGVPSHASDAPPTPYVIPPSQPAFVAESGVVSVRVAPGAAPRFTFGALERWNELETEAKALRPLHPAWVWPRVAETPLFLVRDADAPTVAAFADLIRWAEAGLHPEGHAAESSTVERAKSTTPTT